MSAPPKHARQLAHESISIETVEIGSNRSFGIVMAIACGTLSFFCWFKNIGHLPLILAVVSALFLVLAFLCPRILHPANVLWMKFAHLLHRIISPVVLAILFYGAFTPTALWIKLTGKDPLRLSKDPDSDTYWIDCQQEKSDLKKQF